jgi:membrane protease YdiL (CAAX protease family)
LFTANAQHSAGLKAPAFFVRGATLRPIWRAVIYAVAVPVVAALLWELCDAATMRPPHHFQTLADLIADEVITAAAAVCVALFLRRYVDRRSFASLGFAPRGPWLALLGLGVLFGAGMQAVAYAIMRVFGFAHVVGHGTLAGDVRIILPATLFFLAAAFVEELSFRGYVLQNVWEQWGLWPAVAITSVAFALLHAGNPHAREQTLLTASGLLVFAVWACMSLVWTKSLWLALGAHMAWNMTEGPVFGLPVSGVLMPIPPVLSNTVSGPAWLTGGAFGPEAGASALIALLVGLAALRLLFVKGAFDRVADTREGYARASGSSGPSTVARGR